MTQATWRRRLVASTLRAALDVRRPFWPSPCHDAPPASGLPDGCMAQRRILHRHSVRHVGWWRVSEDERARGGRRARGPAPPGRCALSVVTCCALTSARGAPLTPEKW
eukprot:4735099-Prymnesium_polylepis.1